MQCKAVIFDMDGVLIDSEPFWQQAEIETFTEAGCAITKNHCIQVQGLRIDSAVETIKNQFDCTIPTRLLTDKIINRVAQLIEQKGEAMEGVFELIEQLQTRNIAMGIASSSHMKLINQVVLKLNLSAAISVQHSAEYEEYGKPHPAVYLSAAKQMNIPPSACLVVEDSVNGVIAAKAAFMQVIAIPAPDQLDRKEFGIAELILSSMKNIDNHVLNRWFV